MGDAIANKHLVHSTFSLWHSLNDYFLSVMIQKVLTQITERGEMLNAHRRFLILFSVSFTSDWNDIIFLCFFNDRFFSSSSFFFFFLFHGICSQDFVDYTAPPLWGITNKASLFSLFSPKYVPAYL